MSLQIEAVQEREGARAHAVADAVVRGAQGGVSPCLRRAVPAHCDIRLAVLLLPPTIIPTAAGRRGRGGPLAEAEREAEAEGGAGREQQPLPQQARGSTAIA